MRKAGRSCARLKVVERRSRHRDTDERHAPGLGFCRLQRATASGTGEAWRPEATGLFPDAHPQCGCSPPQLLEKLGPLRCIELPFQF